MSDLRTYLRRYWFEFEGLPVTHPAGGSGCGVTAESCDAASGLLRAALFGGEELPRFSVIEDVDVRELDQGHIAPNMGDPSARGVWFPRGY